MDNRIAIIMLASPFPDRAGDVSNVQITETEESCEWVSESIMCPLLTSHPISNGDNYLLSPNTYIFKRRKLFVPLLWALAFSKTQTALSSIWLMKSISMTR